MPKIIDINNIHDTVKSSIVHLSENLGYDNLSEFMRAETKKMILKYEEESEKIADKTNLNLEQYPNKRIFFRDVSDTTYEKLRVISKRLGFVNVTEFVRSELYKKCGASPTYMLKKNKNFKEIE